MAPTILTEAGHKHISEREADGSWEDCTFDAGLEWFRVCYDRSKPAAHAEAQAIRKDAGLGPTGGANITDLRRGFARRYNRSVAVAISGWDTLKSALGPGSAAVVQGSMSAFGPGHRLSRFQPNFDGGHAVLVANPGDRSERYWWCDPLGPKNGYDGEWITKDELRRFVNAFAGQHLVAAFTRLPQEETMTPLRTYNPGTNVVIKKASNIRSEPKINSTLLRTTAQRESRKIIGTVTGDIDPANGSSVWFMWWSDGRYEFTATDNVLVVEVPPVESAYTKDTQDAAVADAIAETTKQFEEQITSLQSLATIGQAVAEVIKRAQAL